MKTPYTTKMSSKGQVIIPRDVRQSMNLEDGTPFLVIARGDTIVLQRLKEPPWAFLDEFTKQAARQGQAHDESQVAFAKFLKKMKYGR
ncbi:MAG TPA: AbrB/MazE/SpoVT family DNA-binding domain-containing protein [Terriglobales bacterium]